MRTCILVNGLPTDIREVSGAYLNYSSPSVSDLIMLGRRIYVPSEQAGILTSHWVDDGTNCTQVVDSAKTAKEMDDEAVVVVQAAYTARCASFTPFIPHAALYKQTLRTLFPEIIEPEKNVEITYEAVADRLTAIALNPVTTLEQRVLGLQTGILLKELYIKLSTWNMTNETFTLPWEIVP